MKIQNLLRHSLTLLASAALFSAPAKTAQAAQLVKVEITNNAPTGGVAITPVWVGFHSGSFDSYNGGLSAQPGLEALAEDGNTSIVSTQFLDFDATNGGYTYVDNSGPSPADALVRTGDLRDMYRVDGTIGSETGPPPVQPGETVSEIFDIRIDGSNRYFSYLSMVLPTNDLFLANGSPVAHDLKSLYDGVGSVTFNIGLPGTVNDAGTEAESYVTSAANGLFGLAGGQTGPNQGPADPNSLIRNVMGDSPLDALNFIEGTPTAFNFNDAGLYPVGIATVTITAIPEPTSIALVAMGMIGVFATRRRRS